MDALSKSDPQVEMYMKEKNSEKWIIQGRTEVINNNLNPDFSTFIECDYFFEREQQLRFMVFDVDNVKGDKDF